MIAVAATASAAPAVGRSLGPRVRRPATRTGRHPGRLSARVRQVGPGVGLMLALGLALVGLVGVGAGLTATPAQAQAQRIAAVVNEDAISAYDLAARMGIILATGGLPDRPEVRDRLAPQILRGLIDETLKQQEAKRLDITVTEADIAGGVARLERQNNLPAGGLNRAFRQAGLDWDSLVRQIRAEVGWAKAVQKSLSGRVTVSEDEIDLYAQNLRRNLGKPEYLVADIFLAVDAPDQEPEVQAAAERLIQQMRKGANFAALARQFSRGPSAERGGDLGWVGPGDIDAEVLEVLATMAPGNLSQPIRTFGGYHILLLRDQRIASAEALAGLALSRIVLPGSGPQAIAGEERAALLQRINAIRGCEAFNALAADQGPPSGPMGTVNPGLLPPAAQAAIKSLPVGTPTPPLSVETAQVVLMVCDRPEGGLPSREALRQRLRDQKLDALAQRRLRDLRLQAIIDIRL